MGINWENKKNTWVLVYEETCHSLCPHVAINFSPTPKNYQFWFFTKKEQISQQGGCEFCLPFQCASQKFYKTIHHFSTFVQWSKHKTFYNSVFNPVLWKLKRFSFAQSFQHSAQPKVKEIFNISVYVHHTSRALLFQ